MLPGMELMGCGELAVPVEVMQHVVRVESSFNPYAIGVVGGRLARQPRSLAEAVSTARMLERGGYNFSLGLAQVNRRNLASQGLDSYEHAFDACPNLRAGARILADCHRRADQDWGKALSCYYSGNFTTGFRHGYVQKVLASWSAGKAGLAVPAIELAQDRAARADAVVGPRASLVQRRTQSAADRLPGAGGPARRVAMDPAPPGAPAAVPSAPSMQVAGPDDAPVIVQPVGTTAAGPPAAPPAPPGSASADAAFVFDR